MRLVALAVVFAAFVIVLGSSACHSSTGGACRSAGGTCLYALGGGPVCEKQAPASAQDCTSSSVPDWSCCLVIQEEEQDGAVESGATVDDSSVSPGVDATTTPASEASTGDSTTPASEASAEDSTTPASEAGADDANAE
jgi:hypothetical protein